MKILIVEDALAIQQRLRRLLSTVDDVEVVGCADDVVGALSLIDATRPDAVLLDASLRDGDRGLDVLHYVRRHRPHTRVAVLSSHESDRIRATYLEAGAEHYFDKGTEFLAARDWVRDQAGAQR